MKKPSNDKITAAKIIAGVVASLTIGANITGCVYGPPPEETAESAPETKTEETVAVEPTVDPDDNINADVYGPPEDFNVDNNEVPCVYGPPEAFEETIDESH